MPWIPIFPQPTIFHKSVYKILQTVKSFQTDNIHAPFKLKGVNMLVNPTQNGHFYTSVWKTGRIMLRGMASVRL